MICYTKKAEVESYSSQREIVQGVNELGIKPGKLSLFERLQQSVTDLEEISIEEWLNKLEKEIIKSIRSNY